MLETQRQSLSNYYEKTLLKRGRMADRETYERFLAIREKIAGGMDAFVSQHPDMPSVLLKSHLHSLMAEYFEPVIFAENPFFFEMGLREANSWGLSDLSPAGYVRAHREAILHREHPILHNSVSISDLPAYTMI